MFIVAAPQLFSIRAMRLDVNKEHNNCGVHCSIAPIGVQ